MERFLEEISALTKKVNKVTFFSAVLIIFSYLFIVEPFFFIRDYENNLKDKLTKINLYINMQRDMIKATFNELPEYIGSELKNESLNIKSYRNFVHSYINEWSKIAIFHFDNTIIKVIIPEDKKSLYQEQIYLFFNDFSRELKERLRGIPDNFWKQYLEKEIDEDFYSTIRGLIIPLESKVSALIIDIKEKFKTGKITEIPTEKTFERITEFEKEHQIISNIDREIAYLKEGKDILKERFESLKTPVGNITVRISDFIKLFPLVILTSVILISIYLSRLKNSLSLIENLSDTDKKMVSFYIQSVHIPFWLLLVFFIIYIRSSYLILKEESLFQIVGYRNNLEYFLFFVIYLFGVFYLIYSFSKILRLKESVLQ